MGAPASLEDRLAQALPDGVNIHAYHFSTPPTSVPAIFAAPGGQDDERTECESHFLGVTSPDDGHQGEIFVFAIEVLIFTAHALTTVFVSKADSSGFVSRLRPLKASPSISQTVTRIFLDHLLRPRLNNNRLVLSLFARSQNQYLFPGSVENSEKHVLDDRQLIRWWCRVLDSVWRPYDDQQALTSQSGSYTITAHVVVPGCDKGETRAFFPPSHAADPTSFPKWINNYPIQHMSLDTALPLRCLIPRLPDDPKSRFLDDLDGDYVGPEGHWRNVRTLDQFWEMMSYRQECSAGRLVGFIWIVFSPENAREVGVNPDKQVATSFLSDAPEPGPLPTPGNSQLSNSEHARIVGSKGDDLKPIVQPSSPPPSSPILEPMPEHPAEPGKNDEIPNGTAEPSYPAEGSADGIRAADGPTTKPATANLSNTQGQVVIDATDYEILIEYLLELDFAGAEVAARSTRKWLDEIAKKASVSRFGVSIVGRNLPATAGPAVPDTTPQINVLAGLKKKRKPDTDDEPAMPAPGASLPQVLSPTLVRKKPKINNTS